MGRHVPMERCRPGPQLSQESSSMWWFATKRLADAILTAFLVFTFVFFAMRLLPGDPVIAMLGDRASAETLARVRHSLGLNQPLLEQYVRFVWGLLHLDLGRSLINGVDVTATM